ncbi:MAG: NAD(P)H-hydrate dehydratase [Nitrospira sp.]
MKIVTADEIKLLDREATSEYKIPSLLLMENAARGLVDHIEAAFGPVKQKRIVILAGGGNNGGDGIAAARHLRMRGAEAIIYLLSEIEKFEGDARTSLDIWIATGGLLEVVGTFSWECLKEDLQKSDLVIDALLGTGLSHTVEGDYAEAIAAINASDQPVISVDIPSGISSDTGEIFGVAVKADWTFIIALPKRGHFVRAGLEHCGKWEVVDIGIPPALIDRAEINVDLITQEMMQHLPPRRTKGMHKGNMGHLLLIAGSVGTLGAAQMASLAAMRCGTGLVTVALPATVAASNVPFPMEVMTLPLPETNEGTLSLASEKKLLQGIEGKTAIAVGPGLSRHPETQHLVRNLIRQVSIPMIIDADGINAIATDLSILDEKRSRLILTPHPGEMGRLMGTNSDDVQSDRFKIAEEFAKKWDVVLVLKGAHTIVATPDGLLRVNNNGNPTMATAGVGDALTGMIAGLVAQGIMPQDAATLGVYLHGLAGDLAAEVLGEGSLITSDLIGKIPEAIATHLGKGKHDTD